MKKRVVFGGRESPGQFKIYSIIKRERRPKSLLAQFSWPPKSRCPRISDSSRDEGDKK